MALTAANWTLDSYTVATWTDLLTDVSTVATLVMANTAVSPAEVQIRLTDNTPAKLTTILPAYTLAAGTSEVLDLRSINVEANQRIQIQVDIAGVEFLASGVIIS